MKKFTHINKTIKKNNIKLITNDNTIDVDKKNNDNRSPIINFLSKLFESREMAHIYHLQVNGEMGSYAEHVALNEYYDKIIKLLDDLIEIYQGQYGLIYGYNIIFKDESKMTDKITYFENLADFIKSNRYCINEKDTHLHNLIDEIMCLIYKTLYKLKFNK